VDKYVVKGVKKLFCLARTKMRLAEEAGTVEARPAPLPLVMLLAGKELMTVSDCKTHWQMLKGGIDYSDDATVAVAVLQLCDIIECVKHRFEPAEYMPLFGAEEFKRLEAECKAAKAPMTILLMATEAVSCSVFIGEGPPQGVRHYSRGVPGIAPSLHHVYASAHFSDGKKLKNVAFRHGGRTLLGNAVEVALGRYLAKT
jgi:hypothetical protein